jgi:putative solute:sodium symporter small subunit
MNQPPPRDLHHYWRDNIRIVAILLFIWFVTGFGCSIFFIETLNRVKIGNLGLGFWFAQQGSIFVFVGLVLVYAIWMDRLDRKYGIGD